MQLNALIARGDPELQLFEKWDSEAASSAEAGRPQPLQVCVCLACSQYSHAAFVAVQTDGWCLISLYCRPLDTWDCGYVTLGTTLLVLANAFIVSANHATNS